MKRMILCAMAALVAVAVSAQSRGYENGYCSPSVGVDMGRVSVSFSYGYSNGRTSLSGNHALLYDRHTLDVGVGIWF